MTESSLANILLIISFVRCAVLAGVASAEAIWDEEKIDTHPFHCFPVSQRDTHFTPKRFHLGFLYMSF